MMLPERNHSKRRLVEVFQGQPLFPPPIWLMRQAGRYLPEYRALRAKARGFLDLCYTPEFAAEITLQPIRRFGFDAAILFSDILVVPDALGQDVRFVEGEGPRLPPVRSAQELAGLDARGVGPRFSRVFEAARKVRSALPDETSLIGFCGAPWTVATYMAGGKSTPDQADARGWAYRDPQGFQHLIDLLIEVSIDFLSGQAAAGADVLQIFDSWAGSLPEDQFSRWVIAPTRAMVARLKERHPTVPIIGFPRGAGLQTATYVTQTGVDGVGCDSAMPIEFMANQLASDAVVQGNLDPLLLVAGGWALEERVEGLLRAFAGKPFIFNLGHGVVPQTPPEHVSRLVALVRGQT
jgi:uroporphyrinogen decarboxylase